jgi:hypothetical protein
MALSWATLLAYFFGRGVTRLDVACDGDGAALLTGAELRDYFGAIL